MSDEQAWLWGAGLALAGIVVVGAWIVWRKGRPFAGGDVFRTSRLSAGNHLFPTQIVITPTETVEGPRIGFGAR